MGNSIAMNVKVKEYTNKVIGVVKEKYGLRDKGEALDKFAELFGDEFVEREVKEEYVQKLMKIENEHFKKYGFRHTALKDLRKELEGD